MTDKTEQSLLPAYLINGEDHLKRDVALKRLRARLEKLGDLSFNTDNFEGAKASGEDIANACATMPFACEKRLVVTNNAEALGKNAQKKLAEYIANPSEATVLVLVSDKLAKNTSLYKAVAKLSPKAVIDCTPPKKYELVKQVRAMAPSHGITITPSAAQALVDLIGEDTIHLDEELRKLSISHNGTDVVDEREIREMVARVAEVKPWQFVDAFASRNLGECMRLLTMMPSASPYALLRQCVTRVRELICAKTMLESAGNPQQALVNQLNVPDWKVKNHLTWARRFTGSELRRALYESLECERKMKGGTNPDAAFKDWIILVLGK